MRHFCSYFDHRYLARGLALLGSLEEHSRDFRLYVLCLDDVCFDALARAKLANVVPIRLPDMEAFDADLHAARARRSVVEFYFTLTAAFPLYLLARFPEIDLITYLDSDLYFFDDAEKVFGEIGDASIAIIPHRFSETGLIREKYGIYNVGWVSWRRDADGLACLEHYRAACLDWCFDNADGERFADQKYLDDWPTRFGNVKVLQYKGSNLAPWNLENYAFTKEEGGRLLIDGDPIVFYHFQGLKNVEEPTLETTSIKMYATREIDFDGDLVIETLYLPYRDAIAAARARVEGMKLSAPLATMELRHTDAPPPAVPVPPWRDTLDWEASDTLEPDAWRVGESGADMPALVPRKRDFDGDLVGGRDACVLMLEAAIAHASRATGAELVSRWSTRPDESACLARAAAHAGVRVVPGAVGDVAIHVFQESAFELQDIEAVLRKFTTAAPCVILDGVRTFTHQRTRSVSRRFLGDERPRRIWILNRGALEMQLKAAGCTIVRDLVWDESVFIPPLPERADRRTILVLKT